MITMLWIMKWLKQKLCKHPPDRREVEIKHKFGLRKVGTPIFEPNELGYRCPKGHGHITWSEFKEHIWCYKCEIDYHYADDCVLVKNRCMPKDLPKQPRIITGVSNWDKTGNVNPDIKL